VKLQLLASEVTTLLSVKFSYGEVVDVFVNENDKRIKPNRKIAFHFMILSFWNKNFP